MKKPEKEIQFTESLGQSDGIDAPMYRCYRLQHYHRAKDTGRYDLDRLVEDQKEFLIRSAQEFIQSESGQELELRWTNVLMERSPGIFWHIRIKTGGYSPEIKYDVVVMGPDPETVGQELTELRDRYRVKADEEYPGFFLLGTGGHGRYGQELERVPLRENCLMSESELDLHYGDSFSEWSTRFLQGLSDTGLSILRGEPGTGKTSYLRHVIASLISTHRFYYLPPESVGLLSSDQLPEIWKQENLKFPDAVKVMVVEDAESVLLERESHVGNRVSSLLNLTDGFMGDLIHVHIVCTLNSDIAALDDAVLRPGRQKFFREFKSLRFPAASQLAQRLGKTLKQERSYTLAEIYHLDDVNDRSLLSKPNEGAVGFGS